MLCRLKLPYFVADLSPSLAGMGEPGGGGWRSPEFDGTAAGERPRARFVVRSGGGFLRPGPRSSDGSAHRPDQRWPASAPAPSAPPPLERAHMHPGISAASSCVISPRSCRSSKLKKTHPTRTLANRCRPILPLVPGPLNTPLHELKRHYVHALSYKQPLNRFALRAPREVDCYRLCAAEHDAKRECGATSAAARR